MNNILIIRFSSLGDIILTEPVVRILKSTYPASKISYVTKEKYIPLLEMFSGIDRKISLAPETDLKDLCNQLKHQCFDLIVDLHRNLRSQSICRSLRGKKIVAGKEWLKRAARVKLKWLGISPKHAVERYFTALGNLGIADQVTAPRLHLSESERVWRKGTLRERGTNSNYYVIAPGAVHATKRAPVELWSGVVQEIKKGVDDAPLLVGSPDERKFLLEVARQLDLAEQCIFTEEDIRHSAAIIEGGAFTLSNDSGISHLSAALERPTLALFGPTHPSLGFAPLGMHTSYYTVNEYCSPCSLHGKRKCYRQERYCFTRMEPAAIVEKMRSLLPSSSEKSGHTG